MDVGEHTGGDSPRVIAERRRADPQRDRIRLGVLAEIGLLFTSSDDEIAILQRVTEIAVPALANRCAVLLVGADGHLERVAVCVQEHETGAPCSQLAVPLHVRGHVLGVLSLVRVAPATPFDRDDLAFLEELARRVALYLDHAMLLGEQARLIAALEHTNRELDLFADVTCHDLKAPLRGIGHLATWLEEELAPTMPPTSRVHLRLMRDRIHKLEEMIDGILRYSRASRTAEAPTEVDLATLVTEVTELLDPPPTTQIVVEGELPTLRTLRSPLQQVLMNLVGNAMKHAERIEIGCAPSEHGWELYIRDNGPGIAPEHHELVWEMFRTVETPHGQTSTGIGLAIVRKLVEGNGGRAWIDASTGTRDTPGATFRFTWPTTPAQRWRR